MKDQSELEVLVRERLEEIKSIPARDPVLAQRARARFLANAVSASELPRHKGWSSIFRKEQFAMNMLISVLMIAGLLFGGGATVNAAQDDMPNEPLYALKMWSEDVSLQLQKDPEAKVDRLMDLVQIRTQDMTRLIDAGEPVPDQVRLRLEQHIQDALQTCLTLDEPTLDRTLLQIRDRLQDQDRDMEQLLLHTQDQLQLQTQDQLRIQLQDQLQLLTQTRTLLRERLHVVEDGLVNHEMFRERVQNGFHYGQDDDVTPPVQNGNGQQQQNGQPTSAPGGPNTDPNGPNTTPGGPNTDPNGPTTTPGGPNTDPNGPNTTPGGPNTDPGGPNTTPGGTNTDPGGTNTTPGGTNTDPGGPNTTPGGTNTDPGGANTTPGGTNTDPGSNDNGTGSNRP